MRLATAISIALATISTASAQTERDLDSHDHGHAFLNIAVEGNNTFIELESPWNNLVGFEHAPSTDEQHAKVDQAMALLNQPGELFSFNGTDCVVSGAMIESTLGKSDEHHDDHDDGHDDEHHDKHDDDKHADGHDDEHHDEHDEDKHADGHDDEHHDEHDEDKHGDGHDDEHHDEHDDDKHADGHDDEHHDEHDDDKHADGHDEHDHDAEGDTHSEVLASYTFECSNGGDLQSIQVGLFDKMSGFEEVDVQIIGPGGQDAAELTAEQSTIDLSKVQ